MTPSTPSKSVPISPPGRRSATETVAARNGSLRKNFSWMLAGNLIYAGCQWGILSLLAHLGTPAVVGQFVLALAVTAPIISFFLLQMRSVQATDARRDFQFGHYLALRLVALFAALAVVSTISITAGYEPRLLWVILAVALSSCADGLSDICYGLLQQNERLDRVGRSMMLRGMLSLSAIGLTLFFTEQLAWAILAGAAARLLLVAGFDLRNVRRLLAEQHLDWRPCFEWPALWSLAKLAAPLGLVMTLVVLNNNIPRYFVERNLDEAALGIFGAIGYLSVVGTMIVGALGESVTPRLAKVFAQRDRAAFLRIYLRLVALGAGIGLAAIVVSAAAGPLILTLLYGPEYAAHGTLLVWMMTAAAVGYVASFSGYAITAARFFRAQLPLFLVVVGANALACHWLVPRFGLHGAAWSLLIAAAVQLTGIVAILGWALTAESPSRPAQAGISSRTHRGDGLMPTDPPLRVLHVLGALNPGGVESWMLQVLRNFDRERFQLDFLVHSEKPAAYDDDVRALGARILPCPGPRRPWSYGPRFKRILREFGPYDVVHSHVHDFSGYILRLARQAGIPVRIAHSHCDLSHIEQQSGLLRRRYLGLMKGWVNC